MLELLTYNSRAYDRVDDVEWGFDDATLRLWSMLLGLQWGSVLHERLLLIATYRVVTAITLKHKHIEH